MRKYIHPAWVFTQCLMSKTWCHKQAQSQTWPKLEELCRERCLKCLTVALATSQSRAAVIWPSPLKPRWFWLTSSHSGSVREPVRKKRRKREREKRRWSDRELRRWNRMLGSTKSQPQRIGALTIYHIQPSPFVGSQNKSPDSVRDARPRNTHMPFEHTKYTFFVRIWLK